MFPINDAIQMIWFALAEMNIAGPILEIEEREERLYTEFVAWFTDYAWDIEAYWA